MMTTINGGGGLAGRPVVNGNHGDVNRMEEDDEDTPMICMICEDKATGLHYGIITCEG
jgi:nuclear receptor subfamily 6 group A